MKRIPNPARLAFSLVVVLAGGGALLDCGGGDDSAGPSGDASTNDAAGDDGTTDGSNDGGAPACVVDPATKTCGIDASHATIQSAIDDAACERVCVPAGTYKEHLTLGRAFEIVGAGASSTFVDGTGSVAGDAGDVGGAITITGGTVTLRDLTVQKGTALKGGCINSIAPLVLDGVVVTGCSSTWEGGGIYQKGASLTLQNGSDVTTNTLTTTTADSTNDYPGGAGVYAESTIVVVDASTIEKNATSVTRSGLGSHPYGGGLFANGASVLLEAAKISGNAVSTSSADQAFAYGGGIACMNGSVSALSGTSFDGNKADTSSAASINEAQGGALAMINCAATLSSAAFTNDSATATPAAPTSGPQQYARGGAIWMTNGTLNGDLVTFSGNGALATGYSVTAQGGAFYSSDANVAFERTSLDGNIAKTKGAVSSGSAVAYGGAIASFNNNLSVSITFQGTTLSNNTAVADAIDTTVTRISLGGGIFATAGSGSAILTTAFVNSTVSGNTASALGATGTAIARAGGIYAQAGGGAASVRLQLLSATITSNTASGLTNTGGGILIDPGGSSAASGAETSGSIVAGNAATADVDCQTMTPTSLYSHGYDLIGSTTGCTLAGPQTGNLTGDPKLVPLADNGGPTKTHALAADSPALNAGQPGGAAGDFSSAILTTDQRGKPRPTGSSGASLPDIGAFEAQ